MEFTGGSQSLPAPDLAKVLGLQGIRQLLQIMCDAYFDLLKSGFVRPNTPEDDITEQWFVHIMLRWQKASHIAITVIPIPQKRDSTKGKKGKIPPTIDFSFRDRHFPQSYFGAECKLMDGGCREHLGRYVGQKGMGRFLDGRYASQSSAGAMIGYVRVGDPEMVVRDVVKCVSNLPGKPRVKKTKPLRGFKDISESHHKRSYGISPFCIFHLFYAFGRRNATSTRP